MSGQFPGQDDCDRLSAVNLILNRMEPLMALRLYDCNAAIGRRLNAPAATPTSVAELLTEMDRLEIDSAMVSHFSGCESEPLLGNEMLDNEVGDHPRLKRAWTALPDTGGDMPPAAEFVDQLLQSGARSAWIFPKRMNWSLEEWCAGSLLRALQERRVPTLLPFDQTDCNELHAVLSAYPRVPLILTAMPYRSNRVLLPLLEIHANLHVDISPPFAVSEGLEEICWRAGASHLLFGTGYPTNEPGASITQLMYADLSEEERSLIAHGNIERLLEEVIA